MKPITKSNSQAQLQIKEKPNPSETKNPGDPHGNWGITDFLNAHNRRVRELNKQKELPQGREQIEPLSEKIQKYRFLNTSDTVVVVPDDLTLPNSNKEDTGLGGGNESTAGSDKDDEADTDSSSSDVANANSLKNGGVPGEGAEIQIGEDNKSSGDSSEENNGTPPGGKGNDPSNVRHSTDNTVPDPKNIASSTTLREHEPPRHGDEILKFETHSDAEDTHQPPISESRIPSFVRDYPVCSGFLALAFFGAIGATAGAIYATAGAHTATGSNPSDTPIQRLTTFIGNWLYDCKFLENADKCMRFAEKVVSDLMELSSYGERTTESFAYEPMWAECPSNWTLDVPGENRDFYPLALKNVVIHIEDYRSLHTLPLPSGASAVIVQWLATMAALAIFALLQG